MSSVIAPALTLIFQASYDQCQVPTDWKYANVTPLSIQELSEDSALDFSSA
ncbi:hypothetical protein DPMN_061220 [Dreissena polymorpha]|uniref:Uncharacterized protein n=1 Tax=Dreissena polymorpha TaxID=45954 RepID=A0A9D4HIZ2_DREPO|nr:hypothetical protein DPMN_061220 [Dreissena polymorpha]